MSAAAWTRDGSSQRPAQANNRLSQPAQLQLHSQDNFRITIIRQLERLDTPFAITPAITLPLGAAYTFNRVRLFLSTANRRTLVSQPSLRFRRVLLGHESGGADQSQHTR